VTRAAVIITHNRHELLRQTVHAIAPQVDEVLIMDNASDPPVDKDGLEPIEAGWGLSCTYVSTQPPNLAELWLEGILQAEELGSRYVAFLCDDSPPPPGWYNAIVFAMKETEAAVGCSGGARQMIKYAPDHDIFGRMPGWAFILDITTPVRPDPSMHWWWLDTSLDFDARASGGMVKIAGYDVHNIHPNEYTGSRPWAAERIGLDTIAFEAKHGPRPW
jgi:hypothetical protein